MYCAKREMLFVLGMNETEQVSAATCEDCLREYKVEQSTASLQAENVMDDLKDAVRAGAFSVTRKLGESDEKLRARLKLQRGIK